MKRILLLAALCLVSGTAHATIYNINIFGGFIPGGVTFGPPGHASTNACSPAICAGGSNPAFSFSAQPGDVLNFGTLTLRSFIFGDGRQQQLFQYVDANGVFHSTLGTPTALYAGSLGIAYEYTSFLQLSGGGLSYIAACNSADPACLPRLNSLMVDRTLDLTFTLPDSGFIELGWTSPFTYTPPAYVGAVPEPSTWIMMLLGFAALVSMQRWRSTAAAMAIGRCPQEQTTPVLTDRCQSC